MELILQLVGLLLVLAVELALEDMDLFLQKVVFLFNLFLLLHQLLIMLQCIFEISG